MKKINISLKIDPLTLIDSQIILQAHFWDYSFVPNCRGGGGGGGGGGRMKCSRGEIIKIS